MDYSFRFINTLSEVDPAEWNALCPSANPFLDYRFLHALEKSKCVGDDTGWQPYHLVIEARDSLVAAVPGYIKTHSYGEYVFDHSWANAYHQHGKAYYPKWIAAIPFTPVTGPRILTKHAPQMAIQDAIQQGLKQLENKVSSLHWLFANEQTSKTLAPSSYLNRYSVQFQWHNYDYSCFDDFLSALTSRKRKSIKKSRKQLVDASVYIKRKTHDDITDEDIAHFIQCYKQTYMKLSGHEGYLTNGFFEMLFDTMREHLMLVVAYSDATPIASALFFYDENGLYGRYWGALEEISGLHFACCYFEGIEFAIEKNIPIFNPGTQGEHKILRGFEPIFCHSHHHLFAEPFHQAVGRFLDDERHHIIDYYTQAKTVLPFNADFATTLKSTEVSAPRKDTQ